MRLTSNNPRITDVELTNNMHYLTYFVDGELVEMDGDFNFITNSDKEYIGIKERAYTAEDEEIEFEAYFA